MREVRELAACCARTLRARALYLGPRLPRALHAREVAWEDLRGEALGCRRCGLAEGRTHVVFGEGNPKAELLFVGEAPGRDEDLEGRPFVGRSGQLLTRMIEQGMGLARQEVFIANVLKCRPPGNRDPAPDEVECCRPYLLRQIELLRPRVICTLGRHALRALTGYEGPIGRVRGRPMPFREWTILPTFHPAYLLRNPAAKREAWEDLKRVLGLLGLSVPRGKKQHG